MLASHWWRTNGTVVRWTVGAALGAGLVFGLWRGPRAGLLVGGSILALVAVLALTSATLSGMNATMDRQIAARERDAARNAEARRAAQRDQQHP